MTMKQTIYILTLAFGLSRCTQTSEKAADKKTVDTLQTISVDKQQSEIYIKDKSQYDQTFINGLADYNEPIKLIDNYIISGKDTTYFPNDLPLNKVIYFKGVKAERHFLLTVRRVNLTSLTYDFEIIKDNETVDFKNGKAILGSMFFLGPEGDDDIETQSGYGSQEYRDTSKDSWLSIRIEIGKADDGKQRAKINYGNSDKTKQSLDLDECPTLRTE
jgi:hypothetical protein